MYTTGNGIWSERMGGGGGAVCVLKKETFQWRSQGREKSAVQRVELVGGVGSGGKCVPDRGNSMRDAQRDRA